MAILSNINGKFAVDSTGAIQFSGAAGTSGYVLKSTGSSTAPTWVAASTVIGGPYLPLSGGTLTGSTDTASGITFTSGGTISVNATTSLLLALNSTNANGGYLRIMKSGTTEFFIGTRDSVSGTSGTGYDIYTIAGNDLRFFTGGNNLALTIDTSQNVGIGTSSPNPFSWGTRHLTVQSAGTNTYAAIDIIGSGSGAGAILFGGGSGSGTATNVGRAQISAHDGSHLVFSTNASNSGSSFTERMKITSAGAIEIKGSSTTTSAQAFITNDNSLLTIGSSISGSVVKDIQFSSPSAMMYIDGSTGNVGIGPQSIGTLNNKLQVSSGTNDDGIMLTGDGTASGMSSGNYRRIGFRYDDTDTSYSSEIRFVVPVSGTHGGAMDFLTHQSGSTALNSRLYIDQYGNIKTVDGANFYNKSDGWYGAISYNGSLRGYIGSDRQIFAGGSEANMGYMATGDSVFGAGSVEKMRILGSSDSIVQIKSEGGYDSRLDLRAANAGGAEDQIYFSDDSTSGRGRINYTINSGTNDVMSFYTASTERMRITDYGSLCVGNVSGTNLNWGKIQCGGTITVGNSSGTYNTYGRIYGSSTSGLHLIGTTTGTYSSTEGIFVQRAKVGIGTSSPTTKLHLGGTAPLDSIIRQDSTVSGTNWEIGERTAGKWQIWQDDGDTVVTTFMSTGNVGIGTTSPGSILEVVDTSATATTLTLGQIGEVPEIKAGGANTDLRLSAVGAGGWLDLQTNATSRMRILGGGNVGINDTSPGTKLSINGANYVEMATFAAAAGSTSGIVTNNVGYVTSFTTSATHVNSNTALFVPVTDGIKITKAGLLQVTVTQDFISTLSSGYCSVQIRKNGTIMFYSLRTNSNNQWDMINSTGTMLVAANDEIGFYYSATDFTHMDTGSWSQYSFIWTSR